MSKITFTPAEKDMMDKGASFADAVKRDGFARRVCGRVTFPQAISDEHAEKLYRYNFGFVYEVWVDHIVIKDGVTWVLTY